MRSAVIHLHPMAPAKPPTGQPCNGCGACCALEPCPLGTVLSLRRHGACSALEWVDDEGRYRCGILARAAGTGASAGRLVARWIAAGAGCDADIEVQPAARPIEAPADTTARQGADEVTPA